MSKLRHILGRKWCVGEVATAKLHKAAVTPIAYLLSWVIPCCAVATFHRNCLANLGV